jgi:hypothetical protein
MRMSYLSALGKDRRGIDGHLGRYDLCRIGCHSDIGLVGGRACDKKRGNNARRWEASPSHAGLSESVTVRPSQELESSLRPSAALIFPASESYHEHRRTSLPKNHYAVLQFPTIVCVRILFFSFNR